MGSPVYVLYDGNRYTVADRSMEDIQREVERIIASGHPTWLEVNYGEGRPTLARILISPGTRIALHMSDSGSVEDA